MRNLWKGMPRFVQHKKYEIMTPALIKEDGTTVQVRFDAIASRTTLLERGANFTGKAFLVETRAELAELTNQKITAKTKSIWFPEKSHWGGVKYKYISETEVLPRYPVYVVTKGRAVNGLTTKALTVMGVPHILVVEQSELAAYQATSEGNPLVALQVLPQEYLDSYDTCDDLGSSKSKGPGAARNYCLDDSAAKGYAKHWVMDDNLDAFHYLTDNEKYEVETGATLAASEDFIDRFTNVPVAGLNYYSFCKKTDSVPAFVANTRIYSCLLIENGAGYRWRGRYNEDTDLSLRVLKDGLCTIQMNAFLCGKVTTQRMRGGNSQEFYDEEGTMNKSKMIEDLHPDVAKVVWRFNRWHHYVDYRPFKQNKLIERDPSATYPENDYGLKRVER